MQKSGIYQILNLENNHSYIGSTCNLDRRKRRHFTELNCNIHHSIYLQRAYIKYSKDKFEFKVLEYCDKEQLLEREQYYLDELNPEYNICKIAGNCLGIIPSEEVKKKRGEGVSKYYGERNKISPSINYLNKQRIIEDKNKILQRDNEIVELLKQGVEQKEIASKFELSPSVITQIKKKYDIVIETNVRKGSNNSFAKLNEQQVIEIKIMLQNKIKQKDIANKFNVSLRTIKAIQSGQNWSHITINNN